MPLRIPSRVCCVQGAVWVTYYMLLYGWVTTVFGAARRLAQGTKHHPPFDRGAHCSWAGFGTGVGAVAGCHSKGFRLYRVRRTRLCASSSCCL